VSYTFDFRVRLSVAKFNEGRRGGESRTPHLPTDKGEGSSTGAGRMSGMCVENTVDATLN